MLSLHTLAQSHCNRGPNNNKRIDPIRLAAMQPGERGRGTAPCTARCTRRMGDSPSESWPCRAGASLARPAIEGPRQAPRWCWCLRGTRVDLLEPITATMLMSPALTMPRARRGRPVGQSARGTLSKFLLILPFSKSRALFTVVLFLLRFFFFVAGLQLFLLVNVLRASRGSRYKMAR